VSVYKNKDAPRVLWEIMKVRLKEKQAVNISHRKMPTWKQHLAFIRSRANGAWYLIYGNMFYYSDGESEEVCVGWVYLNRRSEIGVMIFPDFRRSGYGEEAVSAIIKKHPRQHYLANINPKNKRSIKFFKRLGFKDCIQQTFEKRA